MPLKPVLGGLLLVSLLACARQESNGEATDTGAATDTSATVPAVATETVAPPPDPALIAEGDTLFRAQCARCHIGEMRSLRTPAVQNLTDAELTQTIRGANQMVSARGTHKVLDLTDSEMAAVVAYIKSLE
ncbi:MAG TPA: c-type cytochrome [Thermoanaerobaculia bacterium]|nr:c-type cytochrome [Thermoanaerobaculia bacterium]